MTAHPGTVYTHIIELGGLIGFFQATLSPLFLRSPAVAANAVLTGLFGQSRQTHDAAPGSDPWLHFANGRGQVLGPRGLFLKAPSDRFDSVARALWATTEAFLDAALGETRPPVLRLN